VLYSLDKTHYKHFETYEINKLAPRAYFIPFSAKKTAERVSVPLARYKSDRVTLLSGEWQFKYYPKISELPTLFDSGEVPFDEILVPSDWQRTGYEPPVYLNTKYPFKLDPPNFPEDCPCAVYRKKFSVSDVTRGYLITFLGVASGFDLYLNGEHFGYSEGAHNPAEFDLTGFVRRGVNEILAVVYKWTTATYLECQDMFRENGIFRDVYLTERQKSFLEDYEIKTVKIGGKYNIKLTIDGKFGENCSVNVAVTDRSGKVLGQKNVLAEKRIFLTIDGIEAADWSAETPNVYYLEITLTDNGQETEFVRDIVGFRTIEIDGEVYRFNDKAVKFLGVNHHDTDPVNGYVMTALQLENDVKLMKAYNINAVRTSHYPPDPIFLMYCDLYGLYVIDEADIETHGCYAEIYKPDLISHDKKWEDRYIDRIKRMYMRDKNRPSIALWSLGNEAGGYNNQDTAYAYLKDVCPEIPVHYEAACRTIRFRYDVTSEMYPDYNRIKKIPLRKAQKKYYGAPYFVCEYCHAMGVGPGSLKEMTELFFSAEIFLGGCIWEWADHAVYHSDGKYKYTYGGDHGEAVHDGNFCVDGLTYPDRKPHTGLLNVKVNYSPVRVKRTGANTFDFLNRYFFKGTEKIAVEYTVEKDGSVTDNGTLRFEVAPEGRESFTLNCGGTEPNPKEKKRKTAVEPDSDIYVTFTYRDTESGEVIASEQLAIAERCGGFSEAVEKDGAAANAADDGIAVTFDGGEVFISKKSGNIERLVYGGKNVLSENPSDGITGIYENVMRAPIDNDRNIAPDMKKLGYDSLVPYVKKIEIDEKKTNGRAVAISVEKYLINGKGHALFKVSNLYTVTADGTVSVAVVLKRKQKRGLRLLTRVGYSFEANECYTRVKYFGRGSAENLPDFKEHAPVGVYEALISDLHEPYIKPQDNNYHTDTRWIEFQTDCGCPAFRIEADGRLLGFAAHDYTQKALAAATHNEDLTRGETVFVSIDGYTAGAGSNSCGPLPLEEYLLRPTKEYKYSFIIRGDANNRK
jgi:beta-galactosidase